MFSVLIGLVSAYMQIMYVLVGGAVMGIGLLVVGYGAYQRLHERSYVAKVVAVRKDAAGTGEYWPVVSFTDDQGQKHEEFANAGSSTLSGRDPGSEIRVIAAGQSGTPMLVRDWWTLVGVGAVMIAVGTPFIVVGLRHLHFDWPTAVVAAGVSCYAASKVVRFIHRLMEARKSGALATQREAFLRRQQERQSLPIASAADITAAKAVRTKWLKAARPFITVAGMVLFLGAGLWLQHQLSFIASSIPTGAVVIDNEASTSSTSGSPTYHAVVRFTDNRGDTRTFRDSVGTSPAWYAVGDQVTVRYLPRDPGDHMIDRGVWNWLPLLFASMLGAALFGAGLYGYWSKRGNR